MIANVTKALNAYMKSPLFFIQATVIYLVFLLLTALASLSIIFAYMSVLAVANQPLELTSTPSLIVAIGILLFLSFMTGGINAGLGKAYRMAYSREKITITKFFGYSMERALDMFALELIRNIVWIAGIGSVIGVVFYFGGAPSQNDPVTWVVIAYALVATFVLHALFTPGMIAAGAFGTDFVSSIRYGFGMLKSNHIFFLVAYVLFAFIWLISFLPLVQIVTLFFAYPIAYMTLISMMDDSVHIAQREED